jgi:hypothetical protein
VVRATSTAIIVVVFLAVMASPASGKEPTRVVVCGKSECHLVVDRHSLRLLVDDGRQVARPPVSQLRRWFTVRVTISWPSRPGVRGHAMYRQRYYPDALMLRGPGRSWSPLTDEQTTLYTSITQDIRAFGAAPDPLPTPDRVAKPPLSVEASTSTSQRVAILGTLGLAAATLGVVVTRRRRSSRPLKDA